MYLEQHDDRRNPVHTQRHPQTDLDFPKCTGPKQIDHIMINSKWRRSLLDVRDRRGAEVGSDHHLLQDQEWFNVHLLKDATQARTFTVKLHNRFEAFEEETDTSDQVQEKWEIIKKAYYQTSKETLGTKTLQHKEWISAVTWEHIQERKQLKTVIGQTESERLKERLQI